MKRVTVLLSVWLVLLSILPIDVQAQTAELDADDRSRIVAQVARYCRAFYVYEDVGIEMGELVQVQLAEGAYDKITNPDQFAQILTDDLRSISHDLHLSVMYKPQRQGNPRRGWFPTEAYDNYQFVAVDHLRGNIGYMRFDGFLDPSGGGIATAESAMVLVSYSDALIFDMRYNGGGSPEMVRFVSSYLFDETPVHLNSLYDRARDYTAEYWTLEDLDGRRMPDIPVYVLTSDYTFSAAEEFTYNLQSLGRATIVGEVTGGGAHPTKVVELSHGFMLYVPYARAINPVTGTNWEGTGVIPDVMVNDDAALKTAHLLAFDTLIEAEGDTDKGDYLRWERTAQLAEYDPVVVDDSVLLEYRGAYYSETSGNWILTLTDSGLVLEGGTWGTFALRPLSETVFQVNSRVRLNIQFDADGRAAQLELFDVAGVFDSAVLFERVD